MRLFFFSLVLFSFVVACKKGNANFTITGTVTDKTFNKSLEGASIDLYEIPAGTTIEKLIGSTTVDSEGQYSFTFARNKVEKYMIIISKDQYFQIAEDITFASLTVKDDNIRNYTTTAKAWVNLHFVHSTGTSSDKLTYLNQAGKKGCIECCESSSKAIYGLIDTMIYCINDGNTLYSYNFQTSGGSFGTKSVTTTAFDTTEILLNY